MDPILGQIIMVGFNFAPVGWLPCNGQLLSISQNTALFSLLGTTYGGDGVTTFALPNLQGRFPVGMGQGAGLSNYVQGQVGGSEGVTITTNSLPTHSHAASVAVGISQTNASTDEAQGNVLAGATTYAPASSSNGTLGGVTATIGATGGSQPLPVINPYVAMNYIIATQGVYPSRP